NKRAPVLFLKPMPQIKTVILMIIPDRRRSIGMYRRAVFVNHS
ncbi:MAG: hypothetical protein ACJAZ3_001823, partial [Sphingobacteriales bacterium]